jgi:hypothetical protein
VVSVNELLKRLALSLQLCQYLAYTSNFFVKTLSVNERGVD